MNSYFKSDQIERHEKIGNLSLPSVLHSVADAYLPDDAGSNSIVSMKHFLTMLGQVNTDLSHVTNILTMSIDKIGQVENVFKYDQVNQALNKPQRLIYPFMYPSDQLSKGYEYKVINFVNNLDSNYLATVDQNSINYSFTTSYFAYSDKKMNDNNEKLSLLTQHLLRVYIPYVFKNIIFVHDEFICPSGWSGISSGHLVGFYYKKVSDTDYIFGLFNSGSGSSHHETKGDRRSCYKLYKGNSVQCCVLLTYGLLHKYILTHDNVDERDFPFSVSDSFYRYETKTHPITNIHLADWTNPKPEVDNIRWIKGQLSGSCTYFGFYYLLKYVIFDHYEDSANIFRIADDHIKNTSISAIINFCENAQTVTEYHKTYIDMIKVIYSVNDNSQTTLNSDELKRIEALNSRYIDDIRSCAVLDISNVDLKNNNNISYRIEPYDIKPFTEYTRADKSNILSYLESLLAYLVSINSIIKSLGERSDINFVYFVIDSYIYALCSDVLDYDMTDDIDQIKLLIIPIVLYKIYYVWCNTLSKLHGHDNYELRMLCVRLILLKINERHNDIYIKKSVSLAPVTTIYQYYSYFSSIDTEFNFTAYPKNQAFALMANYHDIFFYSGSSSYDIKYGNFQPYESFINIDINTNMISWYCAAFLSSSYTVYPAIYHEYQDLLNLALDMIDNKSEFIKFFSIDIARPHKLKTKYQLASLNGHESNYRGVTDSYTVGLSNTDHMSRYLGRDDILEMS